MQLETFRGEDRSSIIRRVYRTLGDDAMIVRSEVLKRPGGDLVELVAVRPRDLDAFRRRLEAGQAAAQRQLARPRVGPYVIAVVGPSGSGKTSTALKLALNPGAMGRRRVGLVTLDTYRAGAVEEIQTYADIANIPLEILYDVVEVSGTIRRLRDREVVIVDTPGRWTDQSEWMLSLRELQPDEVHLVLPAGLRTAVARGCSEQYEDAGITHVLFTKLDELHGDRHLAELTDAVERPALWVTDGHVIPGGLEPAVPRILASLGLRSDEARASRMAG